MASNAKYVDVIVPLPVDGTFTYIIPEEWVDDIHIGIRVIVPFGKKKFYTAIVSLIHSVPPKIISPLKEIMAVVDSKPILRFPQLKFWEWISNYYQSYLGDIYQAAIPSGLKLESETHICLNPDFISEEALSDRENRVLNALSDSKSKPILELSKNVGVRNIIGTLDFLLQKGAIEISEEIKDKFKPKTETYIRLSKHLRDEDNLRKVFEELSRAKKQLDILMRYIDISRCLSKQPKEISKKELLEQTGFSNVVLNGLVEKNILELYKKEIGRLDVSDSSTETENTLNSYQEDAFNQIIKQFKEKQVVLLHGVTSSGKTEIYIHLIQKVLAEGKQVLYLVPEIALTTQLTSRLKRVFGNKLGVYHSKFSDAERVEIWNNVLHDGGYEVVIGVRSSVFLPFRKLGLVIVDEEHETSYKQFSPAPRYHARNAAIVLSGMHGARTLLGSATPAIESYFNAKTDKYGLVELNKRFKEIELPEIIVADLKEAYRKKQMELHFTPMLLEQMKSVLDNKEQVILFQNRRGYAPYVECKECSHIPTCENCDVSLTLHKNSDTLSCHYCGYTQSIPQICPVCHTPNLQEKGFGTERIEEEVLQFFPDTRVARMDLDTTRSKRGYEKIISDFENHKIDVLVGTQMITKGLDFQKVSLVGILNADNLLNFPNFRAHERAFQLIAQVSGRAGRKGRRGTVILQTSSPEHPIIKQVIEYDYVGMFETQSLERKLFHYPPYYRIIQIEIKHKDANITDQASTYLAAEMRKVFGNRVLGPNKPIISRIQNAYIKHILLKIELDSSLDKVKEILHQIVTQTKTHPLFKSVWISLDVDPM